MIRSYSAAIVFCVPDHAEKTQPTPAQELLKRLRECRGLDRPDVQRLGGLDHKQIYDVEERNPNRKFRKKTLIKQLSAIGRQQPFSNPELDEIEGMLGVMRFELPASVRELPPATDLDSRLLYERLVSRFGEELAADRLRMLLLEAEEIEENVLRKLRGHN